MNLLTKHLQEIFNQRCKNNEQYSLRAFAKSLDVPVSTLSEIINQKRPLSKKLGLKIGEKLKMSSDQVKAFVNEEKDPTQQQITLDSFYLISEWWHYGILQLIKTNDFKDDANWIAERLEINPRQASDAVKRLIRVGILSRKDNGSLVDLTDGFTSHLVENFTNQQLKNFQKNALSKAISSIDHDPIELRDNTSMTFAMNKSSIGKAKKEIKKFRRRISKALEQNERPDEVYQLIIGLNPLTKIELKEK